MIKMLQKNKDRTEYGNYRGIAFVAHVGKALLKDRCYETQRLLRGEESAAVKAVRVPPKSFDDEYYAV